MKNTQNSENNQNLEDDVLPEYNFDYHQARPNRFATQVDETKITITKKGRGQEAEGILPPVLLKKLKLLGLKPSLKKDVLTRRIARGKTASFFQSHTFKCGIIAALCPCLRCLLNLESDVAKVFKTSEDVNKALRAILSAIPHGRSQFFAFALIFLFLTRFIANLITQWNPSSRDIKIAIS